MADAAAARPSISASIIVKDAVATIVPCLASFAAHVDEVVVVDTGSTDGTVGAVEAYALEHAPHVRVERFAWCDDFAAARNAALAHLSCEWVFWVDADDVVENASALRTLVEQAAGYAGPVGWSLPYDYATGELIRRVRLVGPRTSWTWHYPVHELLFPTTAEDGVELSSDDVLVVHRRPPGSAADHSERNVLLHERHVASCVAAGELPDARSYFVFAIDLHRAGHLDAAIVRYLQAADMTDDLDERYLSLHSAAECLRALGRILEATELDLRAAALVPDRPDAYFGLAASLLDSGDPAASITWAERGFACPGSDCRYIRPQEAYTYWPYLRYAEAQAALGNNAAALTAARTAQDTWAAPELEDLVARLAGDLLM